MLRIGLTLLLTTLNALAQQRLRPTPVAYNLTGRCHEYTTGRGLKAGIYAIVSGHRRKLGEGAPAGTSGAETGTFDVLLPATATHVVLELSGYHTVTIPVHFAPDIPAEAHFAFYNLAAMTSLDTPPTSVPATLVDFLSLCFIETEGVAYGNWFELNSVRSGKRIIAPTLDSLKSRAIHFPMLPGDYTATLSTPSGQIVSKERFNMGTGVTFKAVRVGKKTEREVTKAMATAKPVPPPASPSADTVSQTGVASTSVPAVTTSSTTTLYFDQSSPDLRTQTRATLDSLIPILTAQSNLMATVTGYTDNVGQRNPNLTLSEYRARAVATYLTGRGVPPGQLVVRWKGPDSTTALSDSEAVKTKSRRVLIQVSPR